MSVNAGCDLGVGLLDDVVVNAWCINDSIRDLVKWRRLITGRHRLQWLVRAVSCIDLTTLAGDDTPSNVARLCHQAMRPIDPSITEAMFTTAAVCVYPSRVADAVEVIRGTKAGDVLKIAAVATGFPSGLYGLHSRLEEITYARESGADEIDVVIDRSLVLTGRWNDLYEELKRMKAACGKAHMKTILATGELDTFRNVYKASMVAMMAGSDFIKTSTGKEAVNATLPVGLVMLRAIRDYYNMTGFKVGFKAAGGIRTSNDAIDWLLLVHRELGDEWTNRKLFRIGASGLLGDIQKELKCLLSSKNTS